MMANEWRPISEAPKDGTEVVLTWMENGQPQEQWPMRWEPEMVNNLTGGGPGMWVCRDMHGQVAHTWSVHVPAGAPTHFKMPGLSAEYLEEMRGFVDAGGKLNSRNGADLLAEVERLRERADKFMWQVRDTCARAEKAEAHLKALAAAFKKFAPDLAEELVKRWHEADGALDDLLAAMGVGQAAKISEEDAAAERAANGQFGLGA